MVILDRFFFTLDNHVKNNIIFFSGFYFIIFIMNKALFFIPFLHLFISEDYQVAYVT